MLYCYIPIENFEALDKKLFLRSGFRKDCKFLRQYDLFCLDTCQWLQMDLLLSDPAYFFTQLRMEARARSTQCIDAK